MGRSRSRSRSRDRDRGRDRSHSSSSSSSEDSAEREERMQRERDDREGGGAPRRSGGLGRYLALSGAIWLSHYISFYLVLFRVDLTKKPARLGLKCSSKTKCHPKNFTIPGRTTRFNRIYQNALK